MNAPIGNLNHVRTGRRLKRRGLPSCRLPKRYQFIDRRGDGWRCRLEEALRAGGLAITFAVEALVAEACDAEKCRQFLSGRLRDSVDLSLAVELELTKSIRDCAARRNAILDRLFVDKPASPADAWAAFDSQRLTPAVDVPQASPLPTNAAAATSGVQAATSGEPRDWGAE